MSDEKPDSGSTEKQVISEDSDSQVVTREEKDKQKAFESFVKSKSAKQRSMNVKVYSPTRVYFDGEALSISATSATGEFDILPEHHRFISLLQECDVIIRTIDQGNRKVSISGGLMHVKADRVAVFLDI
jgi:hypothetical protein